MSRKLIKISNRCQVITSRGYCLGPIGYPYYEEVQYIPPMLGKGANVIEVLPDGREVVLDITNFDKDNSVELKPTVEVSDESTTKEEVKVAPVVQNFGGNQQNQQRPNNQQKNNNNNFNKNKNKNKNNQNQQHQGKPDVIITETEVIHPTPAKTVDVLEEA